MMRFCDPPSPHASFVKLPLPALASGDHMPRVPHHTPAHWVATVVDRVTGAVLLKVDIRDTCMPAFQVRLCRPSDVKRFASCMVLCCPRVYGRVWMRLHRSQRVCLASSKAARHQFAATPFCCSPLLYTTPSTEAPPSCQRPLGSTGYGPSLLSSLPLPAAP